LFDDVSVFDFASNSFEQEKIGEKFEIKERKEIFEIQKSLQCDSHLFEVAVFSLDYFNFSYSLVGVHLPDFYDPNCIEQFSM
jgi:hypothetical protein